MNLNSITQVAEDVGHCGSIASSAIVLAHERSMDISVPPIITFVMLKKLCEFNIRKLSEEFSKSSAVRAEASKLGMSTQSINEGGVKALEEMVDGYFDTVKLERVKFSK